MTRSRFQNVYLKLEMVKSGKLQQRRKFLHRFTHYFCSLNIKGSNDNKEFWRKKIKAFFLDKGLETNSVILK